MKEPTNLREALDAITYASDDGTEYEHNDGCEGEAECAACWVLTIRKVLADHPILSGEELHAASEQVDEWARLDAAHAEGDAVEALVNKVGEDLFNNGITSLGDLKQRLRDLAIDVRAGGVMTNAKIAATFHGADACDHGDYPHGHCVACGKVWGQEALVLTPEQALRAHIADLLTDVDHFGECKANADCDCDICVCTCLIGRLHWAINAEQVTA